MGRVDGGESGWRLARSDPARTLVDVVARSRGGSAGMQRTCRRGRLRELPERLLSNFRWYEYAVNTQTQRRLESDVSHGGE